MFRHSRTQVDRAVSQRKYRVSDSFQLPLVRTSVTSLKLDANEMESSSSQ